ncbi:class-III pyridoxal-phosphate-dependent aminotransferase [Aminipila sp.]|uniref:class-III pyridoxal-phosphate-dependent aminotransferase n=1 Tax=Aminipila sp. TaxID=2060095 RepID=UPI00289C7176|nr:aspartate aminotransferase family protein [Aminipila sp.]
MLNQDIMREHYRSGFISGNQFNGLSVTGVEGNRILLEKGQSLLDFTGQLGAVISGNGNKFINAYIQESLDRYGFVWEESLNEYREEAVRLIFSTIFKDEDWIQKIRFFVTGSEAVEGAILLAKEVTKREVVLTHNYAYHGWTVEARNCSDFPEFGTVVDAQGSYKKAPKDKTEFFQYPFCSQCPFNKNYCECQESKELFCITKLREKICEIGPDNIAAVFCDCILGLAVITPPREYVRQFRALTQEYGILWIDDEIYSGFRTGHWLSYQQFEGIHPDIVCFGKGISNGTFPVSGIGISRKISEILELYKWQICSSFSSHPAGMAAICGNLKYIKDNKLIEHAKEKESIFFQKLMELKEKYECIGDIHGKGMFWGAEICKIVDGKNVPMMKEDRKIVLRKNQEYPLGVLRKICIENGLLIGGYVPNTIRISPSLTFEVDEIKTAFEILDKSIARFEQEIKEKNW